MAGKTGSGIWLHAVPDTTSLLRGSKGCVVVRNETIDKLSDLIAINHSPLLILDHVNYVPYETLMQKRTEISTWLEEWRDSWQNKNIDKYISFYSNKFSALKMNKNVWKRYKAGLNDKYKFIKVAVKDPLIVIRNDQLIINYIQEYESDGLKDSGEKTLYVSRPSGQPAEILTETWKPLAEELLAHKKSED
jgi:murein L,D-transpeptidase YafK